VAKIRDISIVVQGKVLMTIKWKKRDNCFYMIGDGEILGRAYRSSVGNWMIDENLPDEKGREFYRTISLASSVEHGALQLIAHLQEQNGATQY